jgi:hypothetical protein
VSWVRRTGLRLRCAIGGYLRSIVEAAIEHQLRPGIADPSLFVCPHRSRVVRVRQDPDALAASVPRQVNTGHESARLTARVRDAQVVILLRQEVPYPLRPHRVVEEVACRDDGVCVCWSHPAKFHVDRMSDTCHLWRCHAHPRALFLA